MNVSIGRKLCEVVFSILFATAIPAIICAMLLSSSRYENFIFRQAGLPMKGERIVARDDLRLFLAGTDDLSPKLFTEREILHMQDVKKLIDFERAYAYGVVILCVLCIWLRIIPSARLRKLIFRAAVAVLYGSMALGIAGYIWFDQIFTLFHELVFTNDLWLLDPSQHALIRAYPPEFFSHFAQYSSVLVFAVDGILAYVMRKRQSI